MPSTGSQGGIETVAYRGHPRVCKPIFLFCDHIGLSTVVCPSNFSMLPLAHAVPAGSPAIYSSASPKVAQNGMLLKEHAFPSCIVIDLIFDSIPWRLPS